MASLKEIRNRIQSVNSTQQITKAMKMVAAAKLRKAQDNIINLRPYAKELNKIFENLTKSYAEEISSDFLAQREAKKVLLIVITSDRGLCGAFNANVIKFTQQIIQAQYSQQQAAGNLHVLCLGKRGCEFFQKRGFSTIGTFVDVFTKLSFNYVKEAAEFAMQGFLKGHYDRIDIVYNEFKNVATQILRQDQLLPVAAPQTNVQTIAPANNVDYILEPSAAEIIEDIIPKTLKVKLYKAVLESNAAEQGARMSAMDKATENAGDLLKELKLTYNRSRQAAITKEILEIVGGAEALSQG